MAQEHCDEAIRLRALRNTIIGGVAESQIRFGDEEVRYHKADIPRLDAEIARLDRLCEGPCVPRKRFAKRMTFGAF